MKSKLVLIALFLIFTLPVVLPFFLIKGKFETKNNGELIEPIYKMQNVSLKPWNEDIESTLQQEKDTDETLFRHFWTMVVVSEDICDEVCQNNIYEINQIRLTQIKSLDKIQIVWLTGPNPDESLVSEMQEKYEQLQVFVIPDLHSEWYSGFKQSAGDEKLDGIYFVDYLEYFMMKFAADQNPRLVQKDLKHLLKATANVKSVKVKETES